VNRISARGAVLPLLLLCLGLTGCRLATGGPRPIVVTSETITLEWDPPLEQVPSSPIAARAYRVYFRHHNAAGWSSCGTVAATLNPRLVLRHEDFGNGSFDFAVSTVDGIDHESFLRSSLEPSTSADAGWYITWVRADW